MRISRKTMDVPVIRLHTYAPETIIGYLLVAGRCVMAKNTSVTLGKHFDGFISRQVESGRFGSASEVIRAGLRLLENSETRLQTLREALEKGETSGVVDYNYDDFMSELDKELG
jgi:antitoxin ParD1/3/4